jgi:hypothetical protein
LKYAEKDAYRIAQTLAAPRYNFSITSPSKPSDPYQIKRELDRLAKSCRRDDTFLFFFSGHGDLVGGELMLVLNETEPDDETTYLRASWVLEARALCAANNRLIVLDCCHAGGASGRKTATPIDFGALGTSAKTDLMLLASRRIEEAREFDHLEGSFLTAEMCSFLNAVSTRKVSLAQLMAHLNNTAHNYNESLASGIRKVPIPFINGEQEGDFVFTGSLAYTDLSEHVKIRKEQVGGTFPIVLLAVMGLEACYALRGQQIRLSPHYVHEKARLSGQLGSRSEQARSGAHPGHLSAAIMFVLERFGALPGSDWPVDRAPGKVSWRRLDEKASRYKARTFWVKSLDEVNEQLDLNRPVVAACVVHDGIGWGWFDEEGSPVGLIQKPGPDDTVRGAHSVLIVGRSSRGYRFANVWGSGWADGGFGEMTTEAAQVILAQEYMWSIEAQTSALF